MGFPNIIYGGYGDEKVTSSTKIGGLPLGQLMVLPDGRKFRHSQNGAASLEVGVVVATPAGVAGHGNVSASGIAAAATTTYNQIGDTVVRLVCNTACSVTADQYADGILNVQKSAGAGLMYRIKENTSCASASSFSVTLYPEDPLKVAFAATSTKVGLRKNPYKEVVLFAASACLGQPAGVNPVAVNASCYFWLQRAGVASVKTAGTTVTDGLPVQSDSTTSGSITVCANASAATLIWDKVPLGFALGTVTATDAVLVDLTLE